jgi:hypothetical protein
MSQEQAWKKYCACLLPKLREEHNQDCLLKLGEEEHSQIVQVIPG